jgi:nucleotide-sensitive chloride channel 1A
MPLTTIRSPPALDSFTSLADHQAQTPSSFFDAKPVLHHHIVGARVLVPGDQTSKLPLFSAGGAPTDNGTSSTISTGANEEEDQAQASAVVDVFVSSE